MRNASSDGRSPAEGRSGGSHATWTRVSLAYGAGSLAVALCVRLAAGLELVAESSLALTGFVLVAAYPLALAGAWFAGERKAGGDSVAVGAGGLVRAGGGALLLVVAVWIAAAARLPGAADADPRRQPPVPRLVVLPLIDIDTRGDRYFADGMTDELTAGLAAVEGFEILGRVSAQAFVDVNRDAAEIGAELGAPAVLDGTIRRSAGRIGMNLRLIETATGEILWSATGDTTVDGLFDLRDAMVEELAERFELAPTPRTRRRLERRRTDAETFDLYMLGRFRWGAGAAGDLVEATSFYQLAIESDSSFAPPWVALADAYATLPRFTGLPAADVRRDGAAVARTALRLDAEAAAAHTALGEILYAYEWDPEAARPHLARAAELDPGDAAPYERACELELAFGDRAGADAACRAATDRDPLSFRVRWIDARRVHASGGGVAALDRLARDYPDFEPLAADAAIAELAARDPTGSASAALGRWFRLLGAEEAADSLAERAVAAVERRTPDSADSDRLLDRVEQELQPAASHMAALRALVGDTAGAVETGWQALGRRTPGALRFGRFPEYEAMRADTGFVGALRRAGLRVPGAEADSAPGIR